MPSKAEFAQALIELEEECRFWVVEAITLDRGIENLEERVNTHADEIGPARTAEFRVRLDRTRERQAAIEEKIRAVRERLQELKARLRAMPG